MPSAFTKVTVVFVGLLAAVPAIPILHSLLRAIRADNSKDTSSDKNR
jgi:hypothetical protein